MGSTGEGNKGIDSSIGGLVWVRRRNGNWWPGRILGPHEIPEGCVASPKSGTPVKLLGREDASVDWYNLEKSKRVKAFRCGEYDECIEKAKASSSNSRKLIKNARKEVAILHALEIESAHLRKHPSNNQETSNNTQGVNRIKGLEDLGKRKRSQVPHVHEFLKRKNRRKTMTKVLENSVPVIPKGYNSNLTQVQSNGVKEKELSSLVLQNDGLFDVPFITDEKKSPGINEKETTLNESPRIDNVSSEWSLKGKRSRNIINKPSIKQEEEKITEMAPQRFLPCRRSRFTINPKYEDFSLKHNHTSVSSSSLFDAIIQVKDYSNNIPCISVKSKFSVKPIVGHSINVEVLNGSDLSEESDKKMPLRKEKPKKKGTKKSRKNGVLTRKIKKLSSITKRKVGPGPGPQVVTCVPLKVVFGRINEAMNS